jgi:hypothetical protein
MELTVCRHCDENDMRRSVCVGGERIRGRKGVGLREEGGLGLKEEVAGSGQRWRKEDGLEGEAAQGVSWVRVFKRFYFSFFFQNL